jgi:5-methylthioadenosine/S-adenosylhomocysteine deaminase
MLLAGVTGVADHSFHLPAALSAYEELGMRANMASTLFGVGDGVEEHFQGALEEIDHYSRESRPRLRLSLGPHSTYLCPPPFLERVAHEARERELPIHIHVSETAQQVSHSREEHGLTPVELLDTAGCLTKRTLLAHAYFATDRDLELIAERGAAVVHCPKTFMKFGIANDFLPRAVEKGVTLALGTDGAASNSTLDLLEAARDAALLAKVVTKDPHRGRIREILPMLWGAGSFAAGPEAPSIREGMPADLVLYEANTPNLIPRQNLEAHLLYSLSSRAVRDVFVGGELLIRERRHTRLDESELFAHAEEAYVRLVGGGGAERIQTFRG